jgi:hypothetical protein
MKTSKRSLILVATVMGWLVATCASAAVKVISLPANDMVYSTQKGLLYVSVPSRAGEQGNTITAIDPKLGRVVGSVSVGSEPGALGLSDDGTQLYVALDGEAAIRRVNLATFTAAQKISLSQSNLGPIAEDIEVQPGNPFVIAAALANTFVSPRHAGVAIFDHGVRRPAVTPGHTGSNRIEFSNDPGTLYGYNNETTDFGFRTMKVDSQGVMITSVATDLIFGFGVDIEYASGLVFATSGEVVNPSTLTRQGTFAVGFATSVLPEPGRDQVLFLAEDAIQTFRLSTFTPLDSDPLPPEASGTPFNLVRWGNDGLAFLTSERQIVLVSEEGFGGAPPPPAGPWLSAAGLPGFEAKVLINGATVGKSEPDCIVETLCVSGALAGRPEIFIKVIGPRPNGFLWAQISRFTPSKVEIWLRQKSTDKLNYYVLAAVPQSSDDISGFQDRLAFQP